MQQLWVVSIKVWTCTYVGSFLLGKSDSVVHSSSSWEIQTYNGYLQVRVSEYGIPMYPPSPIQALPLKIFWLSPGGAIEPLTPDLTFTGYFWYLLIIDQLGVQWVPIAKALKDLGFTLVGNFNLQEHAGWSKACYCPTGLSMRASSTINQLLDQLFRRTELLFPLLNQAGNTAAKMLGSAAECGASHCEPLGLTLAGPSPACTPPGPVLRLDSQCL